MSFQKLLFVFGLVTSTCPPSGWTTEQDGSCTPDFSDDTEVVCSSDRFSAKISLDQVYWNGAAIVTSADLKTNAKIIINSNTNCEATYDTNQNYFIITDFLYDDCGITAVGDGSKFTMTIPITANDEGRTAGTIKLTKILSFSVQCEFSNSVLASTSYTNDNSDVAISGATTQTIDMSNTFTVGLFEDIAYATTYTTIPVGAKVYAKLTPPGLPSGIKAYYEKCVITDGTSTFNVFDNYKCNSDFAQVVRDNDPADAYTDFSFNFVAFAFVNQQTASYDLTCTIRLCEEAQYETCTGLDVPVACTANYS